MTVSVGVALGSNLGSREAELEAGVSFLRLLAIDGQARESRRIETAPVDCPPGSPPFLNMVVEIELDSTAMPPRELLEKFQAFERGRGRPGGREINAPRPFDLDLLYYGDLACEEPGLIVPHPRAAQRKFVLEPLAELRPDLVLPGQVKTVAQLLAGLR
jgi:2-amino-4-hydroxy-6-hydroxymethyldihydropteridine diphosphokinase